MTAPRRTARTGAAPKEKGKTYSANLKGSDGLKRMEAELARAEAEAEARKNSVREPFRFFVGVNETRQAIIVDEAPEFFRMEHNLLNPRTKRWDRHLPCIDEHTNCPVCAVSDKPAMYCMYLTVIDLTPYENRDGDTIEWSKKLLVVKTGQQKKFARWLEKHGSLRGMVLSFSRDQKKESNIGGTIEFDDDWADETELEGYYTEFENKDKEVIVIDGSQPFDYEAIYPDMTEKQLAAMVGGKTTSSRDDDDDAIGRQRRRPANRRAADDEEEEEAPKRPARTSSRASREEAPAPKRSATRRAPEPEPEEEEETEETPSRPARGSRTASAPTRAARRPVEEPEEEEEPEVEEEEAPTRSARTAAPARRTRQAAPEPEEEVEEEEEDPLPSKAESGSQTNRRAALRRR